MRECGGCTMNINIYNYFILSVYSKNFFIKYKSISIVIIKNKYSYEKRILYKFRTSKYIIFIQ